MPALPLSVQRTTRRAFSLIEAAIVLGIIGLVIGGIWVAASAVNEKQRVSDYQTGMLTIVQNMRPLFRNSYTTSTQWMSLTAIQAGLIPANWITNSSGVIRTPSGRQVDVGLAYDATYLAPSGGNGIYFTWYDLTDKECISLISSLTSRFHDRSDLELLAIGSATYIQSFPVDMATINTNCLGRGGNPAVVFTFQP